MTQLAKISSPEPAGSPPPGDAKTATPFDNMNLKGLIVVGFTIIFVFFGGFIGWAALAPLSSAAIAPGTVSVETNRKTIQHLEGGIISEIRVRDGDKVKSGQILVVLDETQPRASLELVRGRKIAAEVLKARLVAEQNESLEIKFPKWILDEHTDPKIKEAINGQTSIFNARKKAGKGKVKILKQQIAELAEEIGGLKGLIASENRQRELIADEISDISDLVKKGLVPRPRLRRLQRSAAEIDGNLSRNRALIAQANQTITETQFKINEVGTAFANEVVKELRDVQSEIFELAEREIAAKDVMQRTKVRAPLGGTVVNLQVHTSGGVVAPGAPLLDIVPSADRLIIEARVNPSDIDVVHIGLKAQVRFTAFSQRNTEPVDGILAAISADSLTDERTGEVYYLARVEIKDDLKKKLGDAVLYPGMQAEVMIVTGERTALEYFFKPITRSLTRAFREQ